MPSYFRPLGTLTVSLLICLGAAHAQHPPPGPPPPPPPPCTASALRPVVRAESIADLVGDIVVVCVHTNPISLTATVTFNTNVTNNRNFGQGSNITDAVLLVNEGMAGSPTPSFAPGSPMLGTLLTNDTLQWTGVSVPPPAAGLSTMRFTNMRANAAQFGVPAVLSFPVFVTATIVLSGDVSLTAVLNVAAPLRGLVAALQAGHTEASFHVRLQEGFATAFKSLGTPTIFPSLGLVEDGFPVPGSGVNGGGATQSTRFIIRFMHVHLGVRIVVPNGVHTASGRLHLARIIGADANGAGGSIAPNPAGLGLVNISEQAAFVAYEVVGDNGFANEHAAIPIAVCPGQMGPVPCPVLAPPALLDGMQVSVSFGPVSAVTTSDGPAPEPRFVDSGTPMSLP